MKFYTFKRESNDFTDILSDPSIKKMAKTRIKWRNHLMIGLAHNITESTLGYIVLKYGEDITTCCNKDFTPVPNVDYIPKKS